MCQLFQRISQHDLKKTIYVNACSQLSRRILPRHSLLSIHHSSGQRCNTKELITEAYIKHVLLIKFCTHNLKRAILLYRIDYTTAKYLIATWHFTSWSEIIPVSEALLQVNSTQTSFMSTSMMPIHADEHRNRKLSSGKLTLYNCQNISHDVDMGVLWDHQHGQHGQCKSCSNLPGIEPETFLKIWRR